TIVKAGKKLGEGVTMVAGKAGKAAVDGIKTASHKVKEGVNFVASTAKGFADKIGNLWNKGATTVKTTFLQGNEKIQHAVKTLLEYKWIPGEGKGFAIAGVGKVSGGGQYSLKEAYQYMESKVVKGTGEGPVKVNYGEQYAREKRKKILKPNVEYTSKEGYTYTTDSQGRVASCEGSLQLGDGKRNNYAQRVVGGNDRLDDDDGGHLIATIFKGSGNMDNLVPMNSNLNRGEWKKLENEWANALNDGDKVRVKITPNYSGNSKRPDSFVIRYKIGDEDRWRLKNFDNVPGGKLDE
ncbi:DNA/RNA non-specific endonuclease, partial [Bacillus paranthracis]|uniref:DNA/RNA non-specific endonuclease n=2 Tax=Bacillus paranthracis TaxID=2026186 RepID=UPI002E250A83|nr:DNA/RNA non-specific endonuclease [Bacillus paranthracis]MED0860649.1 DNA/RNA non-specific endonuclease [Bacillus paranthracis]MED1316722.1 DNA/RNA non-specific endonuclease [Bacillus paranthracis]MED1319635.1 DNA/RNA non-specific endonuclease [Bacillus paranthracis]MED1395988.1 DNA/RNA non-specific endonuclease [Bacillus paranthracis]